MAWTLMGNVYKTKKKNHQDCQCICCVFNFMHIWIWIFFIVRYGDDSCYFVNDECDACKLCKMSRLVDLHCFQASHMHTFSHAIFISGTDRFVIQLE